MNSPSLGSIKQSSFTFEWKLDNFKELKAKDYTSEIFWTNDRHPWYLEFYPHGHSKSGTIDLSSWVSLYLHAATNDTSERIFFSRIYVTFELYVYVGDVVKRKEASCSFLNAKHWWGYPQFELRTTLINALKDDNDPVLLKVVITPSKSTRYGLSPTPLADLVLSTFLQNPEYSDAVFRIDGQQLYAHTGILIARSEYFAALFRSGMSETVDNANGQRAVIEVTDFGYDVFFAMLKYLYTGSFDFRGCPNVDATNLLKVADKYNVQELKDAMEICIVDALTIDTVVEILFGFAHAYPLLRKACLAFIGDKFEEVMKTGAISKVEWNDSNWQDHAELMNEILESVNKRKPTIDKVD